MNSCTLSINSPLSRIARSGSSSHANADRAVGNHVPGGEIAEYTFNSGIPGDTSTADSASEVNGSDDCDSAYLSLFQSGPSGYIFQATT